MIEFKVMTFMSVEKIMKAVEKATIQPTIKAARMVQAEAKKLLNKGGRKKVKGVIGPHVASAPGEPPKKITGNLHSGIKIAPTGDGGYIIGPTERAEYGEWLEFGTRKMKPRPFMRPALAIVAQKMGRLFKNLNIRIGRPRGG